MYRPGSNDPPRRRWLLVLRVVGFVAGLGAGAFGLWRLVTSDSAKDIQVGLLIGIWGLVLALISLYGTRVQVREVPVAIPVPTGPSGQSQELDLRKVGEIEQAAVAAARREFQNELHAQLERHFAAQLAAARESMQQVMHEQVQVGVAQQVSGLREEVAALRSELVEKVGGQLRLERIETTRLIGSDLEALQYELRRLRELGGLDHDDVAPVAAQRVAQAPVHAQLTRIVEPEVVAEPEAVTAQFPAVAPSAPQPVPVEPEPVPVAAEPEPEPEPASDVVEPEPEPEPASDVVEPEPVAVATEPEPEPEPEPDPEPEPVPAVAAEPARAKESFDPFASLPRLTPFHGDVELLPDPEPEPTAHAVVYPEPDGGNERRRRASRHAVTEDDEEQTTPAGGRRHRADDSANDTLARILARERN